MQSQADAEGELEKAQLALTCYERSQPNQFLPAFYRILGHAPGDFWNMEVDKQRRMLHMLIEEIQVTNISPHIYKLLLKWKDPVAQRWDCALIYKRQAIRTNQLSEQEWMASEDQLLRELWSSAPKVEIMKALPAKSNLAITARASILKVHRPKNMRGCPIYRALCYDDWVRSCVALNIDRDSEEGNRVLEALNYYAQTTDIKERIAIWWILPVVQMNNLDGDHPHRDRSLLSRPQRN